MPEKISVIILKFEQMWFYHRVMHPKTAGGKDSSRDLWNETADGIDSSRDLWNKYSASRTPDFGLGLLFFMKIYQIYFKMGILFGHIFSENGF